MKNLTFRKLASEIAKREGKKSQVKIGDIREILRILVEMEAEFDCIMGSGDKFRGYSPAELIMARACLRPQITAARRRLKK